MKNLLACVIILVLAFSALAQEETNELDPDANECFAGGTMEGRCTTDVNQDGEISQDEIDWAWNCGWYMARFNEGVFGREGVPSWCSVLLPSIAEKPIESIDEDDTSFDCGIFFGGGYTECLKGNYMKQDNGNDGSFEMAWYIINGTIAGNDGLCPAGTSYTNDIAPYVGVDISFYNWIIAHGFSDFDDFCQVL